MMSHIDYDESTSNDDLMELYTNNGSTCMEDMELYSDIGSSSMEDMVEHHYDIVSSCMEDMELYSDIGSPSREDMVEHHYDIDSSCLEDIELDEYLAMQEAAHSHHQAMTFTKFPRGTFYDGSSSSPHYSPSTSRRRNMHKNGHAHAPQHHVATQGRPQQQVLKSISAIMQTPIRRTRHLRQASHRPCHQATSTKHQERHVVQNYKNYKDTTSSRKATQASRATHEVGATSSKKKETKIHHVVPC